MKRGNCQSERCRGPEVASAKQGAPDVAATELDLAYIMYTSGSTGEPKGLMHTHYSGLSYARLSADTYEVTPVDRISDFAPLHVESMHLRLLHSAAQRGDDDRNSGRNCRLPRRSRTAHRGRADFDLGLGTARVDSARRSRRSRRLQSQLSAMGDVRR